MAGRSGAALRLMPWVFVLIWSTGFVVARFAMPHAPPFRFLILRYVLSIAVFAAWVALARARWPQGARQLGHLAVVGVLVHAGYLGGVWSAVRGGIGAGTVALLVGLQPLLTALWMAGPGTVAGSTGAADAPAGVTPRQWAGLALGLAGLVLVVWRKLGGAELTASNFGLAMLALLSITVGTLYQKRHVGPCDVRTASLVQLVAALAVTLPLAWFERDPVVLHPQLVGALAWSVLALTLGGSSLLYLLIQRGAATEVTSLMYLVPPCTAALAWLLFDEAFTLPMLAGLALTAAGVWLVTTQPQASERAL